MTQQESARLTMTLSFIAAALAFAAAVIEYSRGGEIRIGLVAAGVFLVALGLGAQKRSTGSREM